MYYLDFKGKRMCEKECFDYPVYMHVNYFESVFPIEEIISRCAETGYDGIELRGYDRNKKMGVSDYLEYVYNVAARYGLRVTFSCLNDIFSSNICERKKTLDEFKLVIEFASANDIKVLNVFSNSVVNPNFQYINFHANGSAYAKKEQWQATVEYFQDAGEFAGKKGVDLCFETHNCYIHDLGEPTAKLLSAINLPNVKANLDFGNMYLNKLNKGMQEELKFLSGLIGYVHLKNLSSFRQYFESDFFWATMLEDGDINNFVLVLELMKMEYKGIITIETARLGDNRNAAKRDLEYIREVIAEARFIYKEQSQ